MAFSDYAKDTKFKCFVAFNERDIQTLLAILTTMKDFKLSNKETINFIEQYFKDRKANLLRDKNKEEQIDRFACPKCSSLLVVVSIRIPLGVRNINGWKTFIYCSNDNCLYEKYYYEEINKVIEHLRGKRNGNGI